MYDLRNLFTQLFYLFIYLFIVKAAITFQQGAVLLKRVLLSLNQITGIVMRAAKRVQINVALEPVDTLP